MGPLKVNIHAEGSWMILELVLYMLAAAMTGCTVHIAFLDVGVLSLGMAFPTVGDRLLFGISAFPALSGIYLGIYYFNGFLSLHQR